MRHSFIHLAAHEILERFPDKFHFHHDHRWAKGAGHNGFIWATYGELVDKLGEPDDGYDGIRWGMLFRGNTPAWIEAELETTIPRGNYRWYIGGISRDAVTRIAEVLGTNDVEYLTESEEQERDEGRPLSVLRYLVGKPSWTALEKQLPARLCEQFMYIGFTHSDWGTLVHLYKHKDTRRYLILSDCGHAFRYVDGGQHYCEQTDLHEALRRVFSHD